MKKRGRYDGLESGAKVCKDIGPIIYDTTLGHADRYQAELANVGMAYHLWRYEDRAHQPRDEAAVELRRSELDRAYRKSLDVLFERKK